MLEKILDRERIADVLKVLILESIIPVNMDAVIVMLLHIPL